MTAKFDYEYIIIGSGPAGSAAALTLAKLSRRKVAVVEAEQLGGAELNTRDIPYASGMHFSHLYYEATHASDYGISSMNLHFNFPTAVAYQENIAKDLSVDRQEQFKKANIDFIKGFASFADANTIIVGEKQYTAAKFIIATGAKLSTAGIAGTEFVDFLTPETALKNRRLPRAICIVGGGATGCEIAQYFAELKVKTVLIERSDRLLPREDEEVGKEIEKYFTEKLDITILTNARVVALEKDHLSKRVVFSKNNSEKMVRVDAVVMATGSEPNVELGLENAGVKYKRSGICVDKSFQTSCKNIFAVGDVIGDANKFGSSTNIASIQGSVLATNLVLKAKNFINYDGYTRVVNTYPAIATVGMNEDDLIRRDIHCKKAVINLADLTAGKIHGLEYGFIKINADKSGRIYGATIMSPDAQALIQELALAIRHKLTIHEVAGTPHLANSYGEGISLAAKKLIAQYKK